MHGACIFTWKMQTISGSIILVICHQNCSDFYIFDCPSFYTSDFAMAQKKHFVSSMHVINILIHKKYIPYTTYYTFHIQIDGRINLVDHKVFELFSIKCLSSEKCTKTSFACVYFLSSHTNQFYLTIFCGLVGDEICLRRWRCRHKWLFYLTILIRMYKLFDQVAPVKTHPL